MQHPEAPCLTERFESALVYATRLHAGQYRKNPKIPYITHLLSVAAIVLENGGDEDEAIAGLLHDAIEDQGGAATRDQIRQQFGQRVVDIVEGCTESDTIPKPSWEARKQRYLQLMQASTPEVRRVSLADKLHNARSLLASLKQNGNQIWNQFVGGRKKTLEFYRSLLDIYQTKQQDFLVQEFKQVLLELEQLGDASH